MSLLREWKDNSQTVMKFANNASEKVLLFRMYQELFKLIQKKKDTNKKLKRHFAKRLLQNVWHHCSLTKEMKIRLPWETASSLVEWPSS